MNGFTTNKKVKFNKMFEEITKGPPDTPVNILCECAATIIHQNIHDHNTLFENTNSIGHIVIII